MSILITGAAGFIGSHLSEEFINKGMKVIGVDNYQLGRKKNIEKIIDHKNFHFINSDILDDNFTKLVNKKTENIDEIWHFAASSDIQSGTQNYLLDMNNTFLTTAAVCNLAEQLNILKIYFASSGAVYGNKRGRLSENNLCEPISFYGTFKLSSENFLRSNFERFLTKVVIFRFSNIIGSHATHGVIYDFIKKLKNDPDTLEVLGDGTQQKPYLHVSELIDSMMFINSKIGEGFNIFNIGPNDDGAKVKEIANIVIEEMSLNPKISFGLENRGWVGDIPKIQFDTNKLIKLGWEPSFSSLEAVRIATKEIIEENKS